MSDYLAILHEKRSRAFEQARSIVARANEEHRAALTGDEEASWQRAESDVREFDAQIREIQERDERARAADTARRGLEHLVRPQIEDRPGGFNNDSLEQFLRGGHGSSYDLSFANLRASSPDGMLRVEQRDIYAYAGAGTLGGMVQNPTVAAQLYETLLDQGAIWRLGPQIVQTSGGNPVQWPAMTAAGTATITAEGVSLTEADPTLGTILTTPVSFKILTQLSNEVIADAAVDIVPFIGRYAGYAMAQRYGTLFSTGTGTGQPQGYTAGSVTVSATGTCTPDSAIRLQMSINQQYRANGKFATNSGVLSSWRRLRADAGGTTGPWLLSPPSSPGMPEYLYGSPVIEDNSIPVHGSAVKSVAYGDFYNGYLVHDAGFRFERSDDYAFANDLVSFRGVWRLDGRIRDNNAIAVYQATAN